MLCQERGLGVRSRSFLAAWLRSAPSLSEYRIGATHMVGSLWENTAESMVRSVVRVACTATPFVSNFTGPLTVRADAKRTRNAQRVGPAGWKNSEVTHLISRYRYAYGRRSNLAAVCRPGLVPTTPSPLTPTLLTAVVPNMRKRVVRPRSSNECTRGDGAILASPALETRLCCTFAVCDTGFHWIRRCFAHTHDASR
jgi:hypothetical protein